MKVSFSPEDDILVTSDLSIAEIADALGRTRKAIVSRRYNLRRAIKRQAAGGSGISYDGPSTAEEIHLASIRDGYGRGHTLRRMAADTGLCVATVRRIITARCTDIAPTRERRQIHIPDANAHMDLVSAVRQGYTDGFTYAEIAESLGLASRSAVAGLVNRHCADLVGTRKPRVKVSDERAAEIRKMIADRPKPVAVARPTIVRSATASTIEEVISSNPIAFIQARGCRWPLWDPSADLADKSVCGASCGTSTYCVGHARMAYREPVKRAA